MTDEVYKKQVELIVKEYIKNNMSLEVETKRISRHETKFELSIKLGDEVVCTEWMYT